MNPHTFLPFARHLPSSGLIFLLVAALSACSGKEGSPEATQVAATVGTGHISVDQINQVVDSKLLATASPTAVQAARQQVLERLIDQQLAADQATKNKLQDTPEVVAKLEAARLDVLARAYLEQITEPLPKPGAEEISKYYQEHPALFAERRVFNLQEIRIPKATEVMGELQEMATQGRPMEDVAVFLRARQLQFGGGSATRTAEQIPMELLPRVHALKDGQSTVIQAGDSATFLRVASSQQLPVSEEVAAPDIAKHLGNQRAAAAVSDEIKRLRAATTVTYVGEFERSANKPASSP